MYLLSSTVNGFTGIYLLSLFAATSPIFLQNAVNEISMVNGSSWIWNGLHPVTLLSLGLTPRGTWHWNFKRRCKFIGNHKRTYSWILDLFVQYFIFVLKINKIGRIFFKHYNYPHVGRSVYIWLANIVTVVIGLAEIR